MLPVVIVPGFSVPVSALMVIFTLGNTACAAFNAVTVIVVLVMPLSVLTVADEAERFR